MDEIERSMWGTPKSASTIALEEELTATRLRLARVMLAAVYRPDGVEVWMRARTRTFDYRTPTELIRNGEHERVYAEIERMTTGAFG